MTRVTEDERLGQVADVVESIQELDNVAAIQETQTKTSAGTLETTLDVELVVDHTPEINTAESKALKELISEVEDEYDEGAPMSIIRTRADERGLTPDQVDHLIRELRSTGDVYEPKSNHFRVV